MTTLKFDKSVKFMGVRYAAHEAFQVSDEDAVELKKAGAIILAVEAPEAPPADDESQEQEDAEGADEEQEEIKAPVDLKEELLGYTVPELIKFAEERGIDLQKKTKKAEIYNIIVATLE